MYVIFIWLGPSGDFFSLKNCGFQFYNRIHLLHFYCTERIPIFFTEIFDSLNMFHLFAGTVASLESVSVPFSASYQSQTKLFFFSPGNPVSFSWFVIYLVILSCILNILNMEM